MDLGNVGGKMTSDGVALDGSNGKSKDCVKICWKNFRNEEVMWYNGGSFWIVLRILEHLRKPGGLTEPSFISLENPVRCVKICYLQILLRQGISRSHILEADRATLVVILGAMLCCVYELTMVIQGVVRIRAPLSILIL
ncbi:hypothetical protein O6P43_027557 [Quillaja saponaria]|uniref:Uncharacterized protein n=1 Tax=Quillaja saponaria TaxID=32244 RepID=A0AAD7PE32_QUISA|nr:hypothetical protein O6P43_027557 [Quillaja saponaria]